MSKKKGDDGNPLASKMTPISYGLTIVGILDAEIQHMARAAIESVIKEPAVVLGIPTPPVDSILSLCSGNLRQQEAAMVMAAQSTGSGSVRHEYKNVGNRPGFNYLGDEGRGSILNYLDGAHGWVTAEQAIECPVSPACIDGLNRIRNAAKDAKKRVMIFLVVKDGYGKSKLDAVCDEYIEVAKCDANPGDHMAFSVDCVGVKHLNALGIGLTMCSVSLRDHQFHFEFSEFIAAELKTRLMWHMTAANMSYAQIGDVLGCVKSTVMRRLENRRKPLPMVLPEGWQRSYLEAVGVIQDETEGEDDDAENGNVDADIQGADKTDEEDEEDDDEDYEPSNVRKLGANRLTARDRSKR